jgi:thioredoxin-related protein
VNLYEKYRGRVNFVVIDLDQRRSEEQQDLLRRYYRGYIPHVVVLDKQGTPVYNSAGEVDEIEISKILDAALK